MGSENDTMAKKKMQNFRPGKKLFFQVILVLLPILFLGLLEGCFRLAGWFRQEPLFLEVAKKGKSYYQLNPWVARRYFNPNRTFVPTLYPETFEKKKSAQTRRIFCLGGSTTAGFPFDGQVPFPQQLRYLLAQRYPELNIEVINLGLSAINSFSVLDFLPEILARAPDAIVIYMGHNEFYGAYGSASAIQVGENGALIRFYLHLQKLRLMQMLKRLITALTPQAQTISDQQTLMEQVIRDKEIPFGSKKYRQTHQNFADNLDRILSAAQKHRVPVLLSTLVSNVRDLPPLGRKTVPEFADSGIRRLQELVKQGQNAYSQGQFQVSLGAWQQALALDSSAAEIWFRCGRALAALGDSVRAGDYIFSAKDRDPIRFRASEDVNQIIRDSARRHSVTCVDALAYFRAASPQGLPGNSLLCDHLHPNPTGYYLLAQIFYQNLVDRVKWPGGDSTFTPQAKPYFVTSLDWDLGLIKIFKLTHRWPFSQRSVDFNQYRPFGNALTAKIAYQYNFEHQDWVKAHFQMAEHYSSLEEFELARQEYLAVAMFMPENPESYLQIAQTYQLQKDWAASETYLKLALPWAQRPGLVLYQIALSQYEQKKLVQAIATMEQASNHPDLTKTEKQNARFYLAGFYLDGQKSAEARRILQQLLAEDPGFQPATVLLRQLDANHK